MMSSCCREDHSSRKEVFWKLDEKRTDLRNAGLQVRRLMTEIKRRNMLIFCFWCQLHGQDRETFLVQIQDINTKLGCTIPTFTQGPYLRSTHCWWRGLFCDDGSISGSRGLSFPGHASNFWIMRAMQKHGKACARDKWWGWGRTSNWQGLDARGSATLALQDPT